MSPAAPELVGDEVDSDCTGTERCFDEADGDGWRAATDHVVVGARCDAPGDALADALGLLAVARRRRRA